MKKIIIAIVIILILGLIFFLITNKNSSNSEGDNFLSSIFSNIDNSNTCTTSTFFSASPIDIENIDSIIPLGNLSPSSHTFPTDHIYFNFKDGVQDIPVYSPGDLTITNISSSYNSWADPPYTDYTINFSPCDGVDAYYIHTHSLSEKLQKAFDENKGDDCNTYETGGRTYTSCWVEININVTAGETIAQTARKGQGNFDMGIYDMNKEPWIFANTERWKQNRDNYPYTMCPIDYYTTDLKNILYNKFEGFDGQPRTIEPICGTVGQDIPGTAQGVWFLKGTALDAKEGEDKHIALVHSNFDPNQGILSLGISLENIDIPSSLYNFTPTHEGNYNRELNEIKPSNEVYCYDSYGGNASNFKKHTHPYSVS